MKLHVDVLCFPGLYTGSLRGKRDNFLVTSRKTSNRKRRNVIKERVVYAKLESNPEFGNVVLLLLLE